MIVHVDITRVDFEDEEFREGTVVANVDCSHWSADRFRALWEFLHEDPQVLSRPQVHSPTATSAEQRAHVGAVEVVDPVGGSLLEVHNVEA